MKLWLFFALVAVRSVASQPEDIRSLSGRFAASADVPGAAEESPSFRFRIRLWIENIATKERTKLYTGVQGFRWAIAWCADDVLIVYTTDREEDSRPWAYEFTKEGRPSMREPTAAELEIGKRAYDAKYRLKEGPNKPSATLAIRPFSDASPAFATEACALVATSSALAASMANL